VSGAPIAKCTRHQQNDRRAQAFTPCADDVFSDRIDQRNVGTEPLADDSIDGLYIGGDRANSAFRSGARFPCAAHDVGGKPLAVTSTCWVRVRSIKAL
jgi:hypothetical protein